MKVSYSTAQLLDSSIVIVNLIAFAVLCHQFLLAAFACMTLAAYFIQREVRSLKAWATLLGLSFPTSNWKTLLFMGLGLLTGLFLGFLYRQHLETTLWPKAFVWFGLMAATIGAGEELIYRGYVQGVWRKKNKLAAILIAAFAHTAYKVALFLLVPIAVEIDFLFLIKWTFLVGLLFGGLREWSGSIVPVVLAHAVFDILVYSNEGYVPWWVWG